MLWEVQSLAGVELKGSLSGDLATGLVPIVR